MHVFSLQMVVNCREVMGNSPNLSTSLAFLLGFQSGKVKLIKSWFLFCNTNTMVIHALIFLVMIMFRYVLKLSSLFFVQGFGYHVSLEGRQLSDAPWYNISCQSLQVQPSYCL